MKAVIKKQIILKLAKCNTKTFYVQPHNNILQFVNPNQVLSDSDINSIFLAFVNLVKKNTILKYETIYRNKTRSLTNRLNSCMQIIKDKDEIIRKMSQEK